MNDSATGPDVAKTDRRAWYAEVTGYQWLVLAIASAGWIFDVYEGQIFNITRGPLLNDLITVADPAAREEQIRFYGDLFLGIFLAGGTLGGLGFGSLADRWGRRPTMMLTILMYSVFSGLTYFATELWQVGVLRFLVAIGVGGEWAVAAALVAEVFPVRARAHASGIFHASSTFGTWLAAIVGMAVGANWRYAYLLGILPAVLVLWVRARVSEPERWQQRRAEKGIEKLGSFRDLLLNRRWAMRALLGMLLAAVGLGTFWAVTVAGQDLAKQFLLEADVDAAQAQRQAQFAYGIVQATGGGLGLLAFGPICARLGRRRAFILFQLLALLIVPITCYLPQNYTQLLFVLPLFGFFTLAMHAGYAIYFPELFPTNIRATGTSFCFNGGRLLGSTMLFFSGWLKKQPDFDLRRAMTSLSLLFLAGVVVALFLPETRGTELPE